MIHTPQCNIFVTHMQELNADICCSITRSAAKKKELSMQTNFQYLPRCEDDAYGTAEQSQSWQF